VVDGAISIAGSGSQAGAPVVYLPGFGRAQLRAIEDAPVGLQPIAELQYRGAIFSQANGRDWTIRAFLQSSSSGGLGLDVAGDNATKEAIRQARSVLGTVALARLEANVPLKAHFFHGLLAPDLPRSVLEWLDDPQAFQAGRTVEEWGAFREQFKRTYGLDLVNDGVVRVAEALGRRPDDTWEGLWQRFCEAPRLYPQIPQRLQAARPPSQPKGEGLFDRIDAWPQVNDEEESHLRGELAALLPSNPNQAREAVLRLEQRHGCRREWVWARLDRSPLAMAAGPLADLARVTARIPSGTSVAPIAAEYAAWGWQADDAAMRALAAVVTGPDVIAVETAVRAVYSDWLDASCASLQKAVAETGYVPQPAAEWPLGTCVIFSDGLRLDVGHRLLANLESRGLLAQLESRLTALPSVTGTAKPYVSPARGACGPGPGFDPAVAATGARLTIDLLRKQLIAVDYQILGDGAVGDPTGRAWTELGDIDSLGHDQTAKLPRLLDGEVAALAERVAALLAAGWQEVAVVTDHGWLYLPGALPKVELPQHLTQDGAMRKARCARLTAGAITALQTVPWTWDPTVAIAMPPGSGAFQAGQVYEHGGISPQECVTPVIIARAALSGASSGGPLGIAVRWRGLRATVTVTGAPKSCVIDLRSQAGNAASSLLSAAVALGEGTARIVVPDPDVDGSAAFVVVIDGSGNLVMQQAVTVGGDA